MTLRFLFKRFKKINIDCLLQTSRKAKIISKYSYDRDGCKTFTDTTGKQYLCTCFEPYGANKVFPNIDQPDLKARFTFQATANEAWIVLSGQQKMDQTSHHNFNKKVRQYMELSSKKIHKFKTTALLPTYLFSFSAGQYFCLSRQPSQSYKSLNTSLYCQQLMAPHLLQHSKLLWQLADEGLKFYEKFFGYQYPFSKFEVLFFADFSVRAMQNPGLIIFSDSYLFKEQVGQQLMVDLAQTFLHQMAHCWFGDLVTMAWWNDLWLNESFADFMGFLCLQKIKNKIKQFSYETSMISFFRRKWWGYQEDSYSTNHPVKTIIQDTDMAMTNFDGITYSKGGSILKNIIFLIGEENFSEACKDYFNKFAWKNTQYKDFINCLQKYFNIQEFNLIDWTQQWLETKGHNLLALQRKEKNKIVIKQYCLPNCEILKNYKINFSIWNNCNKTTNPIIVKNTTQTQITAEGQGFLLNDGDQCFVQLQLDNQSFHYLSTRICEIQNSLTRVHLWTIFYRRIKYGLLSITSFIQLVFDQIYKQKNISVFQCTLEQLTQLLLHCVSVPSSIFDYTFDQLISLLEKFTDSQFRKVILTCLLSTKSQKMISAFLSNSLGDTIYQKLEIAQLLLTIAPLKYEIIQQVIKSNDLSNVSEELRHLSEGINIVKMSCQQKTQYLFSKILSEQSTLNSSQLESQCKVLRSDEQWYWTIFEKYIKVVQQKIHFSQRQEYFYNVVDGLRRDRVEEKQLEMYRWLKDRSEGKSIFYISLTKMIEDHERYLKIRRGEAIYIK